ncbi:hypothetical protein ACQCVM_22785 [Rossellomorea aquimaris]|nr:hypothetical protein [Bacillus sp. CH30_1T]
MTSTTNVSGSALTMIAVCSPVRPPDAIRTSVDATRKIPIPLSHR